MESSEAAKALPADFFDDSVDAKARNVDVKQLEEQDADWEAFQEFADEVEQQEKEEQGKEREAEEQLENMQYVDRYRQALERAKLQTGKDKRKLEEAADTLEGEDQAVKDAVNQFKKQKRPKMQLESDDDFDPCNWRSRGI